MGITLLEFVQNECPFSADLPVQMLMYRIVQEEVRIFIYIYILTDAKVGRSSHLNYKIADKSNEVQK